MSQDELKFQKMTISPEQAERWLRESNSHNRKMNREKVLFLSREIKAGRWIITHQGICFAASGVLIDGQHRLAAIAMSGVPVTMYVAFNGSFSAQRVIDVLGGRTKQQCLLLGRGKDYKTDILSTARSMLDMTSSRYVSADELGDFIEQYSDAIAFAHDNLKPKIHRITTAQLHANVARAHVTADRRRLAAFCKCMVTGIIIGNDDIAASKLRDFMQRSENGSRGARTEIYGKIQRALRAYIDREPIDKLYCASEELFPLPDHSKKPLAIAS